MLFSKLGAMFRQVSEQAGRQSAHLFLAVATAGQRGRSWVTERERRAIEIIACFGLIGVHSEVGHLVASAF